MTNVVPFTPRTNSEGGWTAAERARLAELAERLSAQGAKVEAVYGVTDEGDPWCVIKDENEEVLIHVARIDGQFVIHDAAADAIQEGDSLWSACDRLLGDVWREPREDVVIPLSARQATSVIALALAVAFIHDIQQAEAAVEPETPAPAPEPAPIAALAAAVGVTAVAGEEARQHLTTQATLAEGLGGGSSDPAPASEPDPATEAIDDGATEAASGHATLELASAAAPVMTEDAAAPTEDSAPALQLIQGSAGADTLQGGDAREAIFGGDGDDSLNGGGGADELHGGSGADTLDGGGAEPFRFDTLDGGDGDDVINLAGDAVATGGKGADTFVIHPRPAADGSGLLGVITDFHAEQGDRLVSPKDRPVTQLSENVVTNMPGVQGFGPATSGQGFNGRQVFVDYNEDGIADGHVLIANKVDPGGASYPAVVASTIHGHDFSDGDYGFKALPDGYALLA